MKYIIIFAMAMIAIASIFYGKHLGYEEAEKQVYCDLVKLGISANEGDQQAQLVLVQLDSIYSKDTNANTSILVKSIGRVRHGMVSVKPRIAQ